MQEPAISAAIDKVVAMHPSLAELASHLDRDEIGWVLTPAFLDAYVRSPIRATKRALLLRALFGDPTLFRASFIERLTPALARRVVAYLQAIPSDPLRTGSCLQHEIPKPLLRLFGVRDVSFRELVDLVLPLLWGRTIDTPVIDPPEALPGLADPAVRDALAPLLSARLLDDATAATLAVEGLSATAAAYYFDSSVDPINVRNLALYCGKVLDGNRDGGRAQNKLPLQLSRRFGIAPRSIPDALVLMDVVALVHDGLIAPASGDALRLHGLFDHSVPGGAAFWEPAIAAHRRRPLLHPGADVDLDNAGVFDTSLRYNLSRATGLIEGRRARLAAFAPYYATLQAKPFAEHCKRTWDAISARLARRTAALAADPSFNMPALRVRDVGNILALGELVPAGSLYLPSVAKFALGVPEPVPTGKGKAFRRTGRTKERRPDGAVLAALQAKLDAQSKKPDAAE